MTNIALLSALVTVGRLLFAFLPNVQPMTFFLIWLVIYIDFKTGWLIMLISLLVTNLYLGFGIWTFFQLMAYSAILLLTKLLKPAFINKISLLFSWCFASGLLYGFIISCLQFVLLRMPHFLPYYLSGFPFDIYHAVGNLGFALILTPVLRRFNPQLQRKLMTTRKGDLK